MLHFSDSEAYNAVVELGDMEFPRQLQNFPMFW